ncbi:zinc-binding alcohol dehydrogenase family protein [Aspergillus mulundensis]|uniref:Enoyl reductase (ER) domain-containing protein n=1 Tax=Aspergillus mulundensis TaxID=1810919 RepID=A0A3D8QJB9_9EURO|nr:Uncharacterized protein DSM5745_10442 [Aspergillus mulundensis]RDW61770.1 Uncharacterized protein DSM5745_10442 [Aspergillus mulundensis]
MAPSYAHHLPAGFSPAVLYLPAAKQTAIVQESNGKSTIDANAPLPTPEPDMVVVHVVAVSINPADWKIPLRFPAPGALNGCDFAGIVLAIGPDAAKVHPTLRPGDRVCGGVHGANPIDPGTGAFAEMVAAHADLVLRMPDTMTWEQGAVLGGSVLSTLSIALYHSLGLTGTPESPVEGDPTPVLVYGGSTSTGTAALQILRRQACSGYKPITTCSPHSSALVQAHGATECFNYRSDACGSEIKRATNGRLRHVLDIITDMPSQLACFTAFGRLGGKYACLERPNPNLPRSRLIKVDMVVGLAATGKEIALRDGYERAANPELRKTAARLFRSVQGMLDKGEFVPHPAKVLEGRFEGVLEGLRVLREGVTGVKLVVFIDESEGHRMID